MNELRQLQRHYDKFTLPERDRLVLVALEREDWEQIRALVERCPDATARWTPPHWCWRRDGY